MNEHCKAAKDHITVAESGDAKMAAYRRAAEEIEKAILEDDLPQREVAKQIGKGESYVQRLLKALYQSRANDKEFAIDWQSGSNKREDLAARPMMPPRLEDQVDLATRLLASPRIAEAVVSSRSQAASNIRTVVSQHNADERQRNINQAEHRRQVEAMPIGSLFTRISDRLDDWSRSVMEIEDDLIEAHDQFGASIVVTALRMHAETCMRIADRMELDRAAGIIEAAK